MAEAPVPDRPNIHNQLATGLEAKRLGLLHELAPAACTIGALVDETYSSADNQVRDLQDAARQLGVNMVISRSKPDGDLPAAFKGLVNQGTGAVLVCASPSFNRRREQPDEVIE